MKSLLPILLLIAFASAEVSTGRKTNSGVPLGYQDNPYTYTYGRIETVNYFKRGDGYITEFRVHPVGTYMIYPGDVLGMCGDQREILDFTTNDMVILVYSKRLTYRDCHTLIRIDVISQARTAGQKAFQIDDKPVGLGIQ